MAHQLPAVPIVTMPPWAQELEIAWPVAFTIEFAKMFLGISELRLQTALRHEDELPTQYFEGGMRAEFDDVKGVLVPLWAALRHIISLPPFLALIADSRGIGAALDRLRADPALKTTCLEWQPETPVADMGGDEWWHDCLVPPPPSPLPAIAEVSASAPPRFRRSSRVAAVITARDASPPPARAPTPPPFIACSAVRVFAPQAAGFYPSTVPKAKTLLKFDAVVITDSKTKLFVMSAKRPATSAPTDEPAPKRSRTGAATGKGKGKGKGTGTGKGKGKGKASTAKKTKGPPKARAPRRPTIAQTIPDHLATRMSSPCTRCGPRGFVCLRANGKACKRCANSKKPCSLDHEKKATRKKTQGLPEHQYKKKSTTSSAAQTSSGGTEVLGKRTVTKAKSRPYVPVFTDDEEDGEEWVRASAADVDEEAKADEEDQDDADVQGGDETVDAASIARGDVGARRLMAEADIASQIALAYVSFMASLT
ncbi:hypothetical protein CONPUDRAFT_152730 [Coniophora puteana RWD-64-598 SS2]|uniref:Uncharacterized protein n=1 Tax=Coniophora puteana (strain RWD-64-598) TaxID=741705 RepID=A0A5M3MRW0_CONPW|nr:uncharacterized protein CONPUDRAFT_152730 [Coniophora puteana RWD-64-598 SS2]EIW81826.1 hypothetical protein CONPUDRAFT_152730 [Coniophora puteana RWD-64-598 SS2]